MNVSVGKNKELDVFNLQPEDIQMKHIILALPNICRYGGRIETFYSVAQHAVLLARHFKHINKHYLVGHALLHDAAEAYYGDIVLPIKLRFPEFLELEDKTTEMVYRKYGVDPEFHEEFDYYDKNIAYNEGRDLHLFGEGFEWNCWEPLPDLNIDPWYPTLARQEFIRELKLEFGGDIISS